MLISAVAWIESALAIKCLSFVPCLFTLQLHFEVDSHDSLVGFGRLIRLDLKLTTNLKVTSARLLLPTRTSFLETQFYHVEEGRWFWRGEPSQAVALISRCCNHFMVDIYWCWIYNNSTLSVAQSIPPLNPESTGLLGHDSQLHLTPTHSSSTAIISGIGDLTEKAWTVTRLLQEGLSWTINNKYQNPNSWESNNSIYDKNNLTNRKEGIKELVDKNFFKKEKWLSLQEVWFVHRIYCSIVVCSSFGYMHNDMEQSNIILQCYEWYTAVKISWATYAPSFEL